MQLVGQVRIIAACIILCNFETFELWQMRWGDAVAECVHDVCEKDLERKIKLPWIMIPVSTKAVSCDHALAVEARACDAAN